MKKFAKEIIIGIAAMVVLTLIGSYFKCPSPCKEIEKTIYGQIINECNLEFISDIEVSCDGVLVRGLSSDKDGKFSLVLMGCNSKDHKFSIKHRDYDDVSIFRTINFNSIQSQSIGEIKLKPTQGCTQCDEITQIVYHLIDSTMGKTTETIHSLGSGTVSFDGLFEIALRNELEDFLHNHRVSNFNSDCPEYIDMFEWIGRHKVKPYEVGDYEIPSGQKVFINEFVKRITQMQNEWQVNFSKVNCIGAADKQDVSSIPLDKSKTGIAFPPSDPFTVYYDGCNGDHLVSKLYPILFGQGSRSGAAYTISDHIRDNCDLSATRGFVVAKYLSQILPGNTEISYSAEGAVGSGKNNPDSRRVSIEVTFVGGKKEILN